MPAATGRGTYEQEERRLLAAWCGFAVALVSMRLWILWLWDRAVPEGTGVWKWTPFLFAEDLLVFGAICLGTLWLHRRIARRALRRLLRLVVWGISVGGTLYAAVNVEVFRYLRTPLTFRLWQLSDNLKGVRASVNAALDPHDGPALWLLPATSIAAAAVTLLKGKSCPCICRRICTLTALGIGWATLTLPFLLATGIEREIYANPHIEILRSWLADDDPFVAGHFDRSDMDEFDPACLTATGCAHAQGAWRGMNLIMVVLESVGAQYLGVYDAPYPTTPHLEGLARRHGILVEHFYAHTPSTSAAMASMFCSLLPRHGWRAIPGKYPGIAIPGLGDLLRQRGYRTAFLHSGDLSFDNEDRFLLEHGFEKVRDYRSLVESTPGSGPISTERGGNGQTCDRALFEAAKRWLASNASSPFFLVIWTIQTHHPYITDRASRFVRDDDLNRYLLAIRETDELIADLWSYLETRGLLDNTVVIVTADHGEAFRQHGHIAHGQTLFEEEIRIPLLFLSKRIERPLKLTGTVRQIDLAPTLAALLGIPRAPEWQGQEHCFCHPRDLPVYLFTWYNHYLFGVLHGRQKYIYDASTGRSRIYDMTTDPGEKYPLDGSGSPFGPLAHRKLAAWLRFQNSFLRAHVPSTAD